MQELAAPSLRADARAGRRRHAGRLRRPQAGQCQGARSRSRTRRSPGSRRWARRRARAPDDPHLQGELGARGLEADRRRRLQAVQDLRDLRLVGRARPQDQGRRPAVARGLLHHHARPDEPELELLPRLQHRLSQQVRPRLRPHRLEPDGARRLLVARLLLDDRRVDRRDLCAGPRELRGRQRHRSSCRSSRSA